MSDGKTVTAALLIIGNEILSGRTHDKNIPHIAGRLNEAGIRLREVRVVPDVEAEVVQAVNRLRSKYTYLFTTGGIGPTHDDITAECVAKAFGRDLIRHPEANRRLVAHYERTGMEYNEMRQRMANTPEGAGLIDNPVSTAPGFVVENVYVMAGVPRIMQAMLDNVIPTLTGGPKMLSRTVIAELGEGVIAGGLQAIQKRFPDIDIGSYPAYTNEGFRTSLVLRGTDSETLDLAADDVRTLIVSLGGSPQDGDAT
ncbi:competence/damage-inducible protein A [Hwanghaeella sp.]|uniref:competence/damage-inducible protein A n=1 Tax=Hwanghaeella sp. TaxID=2605943 RepID=UPI003CCC0CB0